MNPMKDILRQITTKQELIHISNDAPDVWNAVMADETLFEAPPGLTIPPDASLWHRLCFLHSGSEHDLERHAWNLFYIAMITFDTERLASWLNALLDAFMTNECLVSLPPELRCRLLGAKSCALKLPASKNPFQYAESALSFTMQALEYNFRNSDFHFWVQLEYNRCFYLNIQTKGNLKDHIDRSLNLSLSLLKTVHNAPGISGRLIRDIHNAIGIAYSQRHGGNQTDNIEQSIHHHQMALELALNDSSAECGPLYNNIGLMYRQRIAGDYADNIETSIHYLDNALAAHLKTGRHLLIAQTLTNLGVSYCERLFGNRKDNLDKAIEFYRRALEYMDPEKHAGFRAWTQNNLGVAYQLLPAGRDGINQERALNSFRRALDFRKKESTPWDWLLTTLNLSKLYSERHRGNHRRNCEKAMQLMDGALDVIPRDISPLLWAKTNITLGIIWSRYLTGNERVNLEKAAGHFMAALDVLKSAALPVETRDAALWLGRVMIRLERFSDAEDALHIAARADASRYRQMFMNLSRIREIESGSELYFLMAESLARQGNDTNALLWLEKGKSRVLTEQLRMDEAIFQELPRQRQHDCLELTAKLNSLQFEHFIPGKDVKPIVDETRRIHDELNRFIEAIRDEHPEFMRVGDHSDDAVETPAKGECVIEYNITNIGTRIFIVFSQNGKRCVRSVFNGAFKRNDLNSFIKTWMAEKTRVHTDSSAENIDAWSRFMLKKMKTLSIHLFEPVRNSVDALEPRCLVFVPHLSLHMLPLHLMPVSRSRLSELLIDTYSISYLPSLTTGGLCRRKESLTDAASVVGISNPTLDLAWADCETDRILRLFSDSRTVLLRGQDAHRNAVGDAMTSAAYIHFAGHARFDAAEPYNSYLALASPSDQQQEPAQTRLISHTITSDPLYLADIYRTLHLDHHPLVVLSCCESGHTTESDNNDEFIGFAAGFMSSGARAVMSSLWLVDDQATCELMELFYRNHIQCGMKASDALRRAQLDIRSQSKYALPYYWAAFKMNGF
jgi:CHAT domain-containing protein